jgi:hypothetical protein
MEKIVEELDQSDKNYKHSVRYDIPEDTGVEGINALYIRKVGIKGKTASRIRVTVEEV